MTIPYSPRVQLQSPCGFTAASPGRLLLHGVAPGAPGWGLLMEPSGNE